MARHKGYITLDPTSARRVPSILVLAAGFVRTRVGEDRPIKQGGFYLLANLLGPSGPGHTPAPSVFRRLIENSYQFHERGIRPALEESPPLSGTNPRREQQDLRFVEEVAGAVHRRNGERKRPRKHHDQPIEPLTPREIGILRLLADGLTNPDIARRLVVSTGTVKNHVQRIIQKLGVSDRTQAAVRAMELGLISSQ